MSHPDICDNCGHLHRQALVRKCPCCKAGMEAESNDA